MKILAITINSIVKKIFIWYISYYVLASFKVATISVFFLSKHLNLCLLHYIVYNVADRQTDVKLISSKHDVNQVKLKKSSDQCPYKIKIKSISYGTQVVFLMLGREETKNNWKKITRRIPYVTINNFTLQFHIMY